MFFLVFPILLLILSFLGMGALSYLLLRRWLPAMPIWLESVTVYFLGQGIIATLLMFLGLAKQFSPTAVLSALCVSGAVGGWYIWSVGPKWKDLAARFASGVKAFSPIWKGIFLLMVLLLMAGGMTLGGNVEGDAIAYYLALPKVIAYSHAIVPLPGYEHFSSVGVLAEVLVAALMSMGMPNVSPRIFSWLNYFPALVLLFGLAQRCGLGNWGRLLAVIIGVTSSAAVVLWGGGKIDLYAVGPSFAACLFALMAWEGQGRKPLLFLSGFFCGLASVFKLSYIIPLLPAVLLLLSWQQLADAIQVARGGGWNRVGKCIWSLFYDVLLFGFGFALMLVPHFFKNLYLLDSLLGNSVPQTAWFSESTTMRLLLSYPLALTYGRYWAQHGTLSPLVLAFAPLVLLIPRPLDWRESRLAALSITSLIGMAFWLALVPSIFMPRYYLGTLIILGIPAAAGAEVALRRGGGLAYSVLAAIVVTMLLTPMHVKSRFNAFNPVQTARYLLDPGNTVLASSPMPSYCLAHLAINEAAQDDGRVFMFTYYRFWLRPELLMSISTNKEFGEMTSDMNTFWDRFREAGFKYFLADKNIFPHSKDFIEALPDGYILRPLYQGEVLSAYELQESPS